MQKKPLINKEFLANRKKVTENDKTSGVYLLFDKDEVVYVGQGILAEQRVKTHIGTEKKFDSYHIIYCKREDLNRIEAKYICEYAPKYNHKITCKDTDIAPLGECIEYGHKPLTFTGALIGHKLYVDLSTTELTLVKRRNQDAKKYYTK